MDPTISVLDTKDGPKLVSKDFLLPEWQQLLKSSRVQRLVAPTNEDVGFQGVILLHIRIGDLCVRAWFGVVVMLAIARFLGTYFVDRFVKGIFHQGKRILPMKYKPVPIFDSTL